MSPQRCSSAAFNATSATIIRQHSTERAAQGPRALCMRLLRPSYPRSLARPPSYPPPSPRPRLLQGAFAEAQARYLAPNPSAVDQLAGLLSAKAIGVVAHFYMDPQVQGVLTSAAARWPHVHISDSLVMADTAVQMAAAGCR